MRLGAASITPIDYLESTERREKEVELAASILGRMQPIIDFALEQTCRVLDTDQPIFEQTRIGRLGAAFTVRKIKTMPDNPENDDIQMGTKDSRSPTFSQWLRKLRIDEALQLKQVISGEMSLVGADRPLMVKTHKAMKEADPDLYEGYREATDKITPSIISIAALHRHCKGEEDYIGSMELARWYVTRGASPKNDDRIRRRILWGTVLYLEPKINDIPEMLFYRRPKINDKPKIFNLAA